MSQEHRYILFYPKRWKKDYLTRFSDHGIRIIDYFYMSRENRILGIRTDNKISPEAIKDFREDNYSLFEEMY